MTTKQNYSIVTHFLLKSCTASTLIVTVAFIGFIFYVAFPAFQSNGLSFITSDNWDYSTDTYGMRTYLVGTLYLTAVTMTIAVPLSLFTAIYIAEYAPRAVVTIMRPLIELLVGIPSVVYGIFGLFILEDIFDAHVNPFLNDYLGFIPLFRTHGTGGEGLLLASVVLAVMILPTVTTIAEDSIRAVPRAYREASFAVGANHWQTVKKVVLPSAKKGVVLGAVLGMMRAMGETMAIVMLMGNIPKVPESITSTGYAMTSKILNDITYHLIDDGARAALFGIAAVLFLLEIACVGVARKIGGKT